MVSVRLIYRCNIASCMKNTDFIGWHCSQSAELQPADAYSLAAELC